MTKSNEKTVAEPIKLAFAEIISGSIVKEVTPVDISFNHPITGQVVETTVHVKALPYSVGKAFNERWEENNKAIREGGNVDKQIIIDYVTAILCDEQGNPVGDAETIENNLPQNVIVGIFNAVMGSKEEAGKS